MNWTHMISKRWSFGSAAIIGCIAALALASCSSLSTQPSGSPLTKNAPSPRSTTSGVRIPTFPPVPSFSGDTNVPNFASSIPTGRPGPAYALGGTGSGQYTFTATNAEVWIYLQNNAHTSMTYSVSDTQNALTQKPMTLTASQGEEDIWSTSVPIGDIITIRVTATGSWSGNISGVSKG